MGSETTGRMVQFEVTCSIFDDKDRGTPATIEECDAFFNWLTNGEYGQDGFLGAIDNSFDGVEPSRNAVQGEIISGLRRKMKYMAEVVAACQAYRALITSPNMPTVKALESAMVKMFEALAAFEADLATAPEQS